MNFNKIFSFSNFSKAVGYIFMYFVFTTVLYFILSLLNRLPETWNYFHVMLLTIVISLIGQSIKKILNE